jgi:uncharacterized protein YecT (DUF1311 family)
MRTHITTIAVLAGAALAAVPAVSSAAALAPPVVKEGFTPLPCGGSPAHRSTIQQEGCAEHQILASDKTINALNVRVWGTLTKTPAKIGFIASNKSWLSYRSAFCTTAASAFLGGTQAPVVTAQCEAALDTEHITDLRTLLQDK